MLRYFIPPRGRKYAAAIAILLGGYFLLKNLNIIHDGWDIGVLWPLVMIVPGVLFLLTKDQDTTTRSKKS